MIKLETYALALNAVKVPGPDYRMDQTVKLSKMATAVDTANLIQAALKSLAGQKLENVVINSHGSPGFVHLGKDANDRQTGIGIEHVGLFSQFKNKLGTIWLTGCQIAGDSICRAGKVFCSQLAIAAGCNVVAADVYQYVNPGYYLLLFPKNCIDEFEGTAYRWDAKGKNEVYSRRDWLGFQ